jgi:transcriptional regulator with XRE-family HTH domain
MTHYSEWIPVTLKALRNANEWTLKQLAERTELSVSYLSDLERGRTLPSIDTLDRILTALGTTLVLKVDDDYQPPGYVWIERKQLSELAQLVAKITPKD